MTLAEARDYWVRATTLRLATGKTYAGSYVDAALSALAWALAELEKETGQ